MNYAEITEVVNLANCHYPTKQLSPFISSTTFFAFIALCCLLFILESTLFSFQGADLPALA